MSEVLDLEAARRRRTGQSQKSTLRLHIEWLAGFPCSRGKQEAAAKYRQSRLLKTWVAETSAEWGKGYAAEQLRAALADIEETT